MHNTIFKFICAIRVQESTIGALEMTIIFRILKYYLHVIFYDEICFCHIVKGTRCGALNRHESLNTLFPFFLSECFTLWYTYSNTNTNSHFCFTVMISLLKYWHQFLFLKINGSSICLPLCTLKPRMISNGHMHYGQMSRQALRMWRHAPDSNVQVCVGVTYVVPIFNIGTPVNKWTATVSLWFSEPLLFSYLKQRTTWILHVGQKPIIYGLFVDKNTIYIRTTTISLYVNKKF